MCHFDDSLDTHSFIASALHYKLKFIPSGMKALHTARYVF